MSEASAEFSISFEQALEMVIRHSPVVTVKVRHWSDWTIRWIDPATLFEASESTY